MELNGKHLLRDFLMYVLINYNCSIMIRSSSGSSITTLVVLGEGTAVNALFEVDGWVFAELDCMAGLVRAWIPADKVEAN